LAFVLLDSKRQQNYSHYNRKEKQRHRVVSGQAVKKPHRHSEELAYHIN
jgi:hypothetical protein